jgi:two-component system KDP operon response regulator KdpE
MGEDRRGQYSVLVVDDEPQIRVALQTILGSRGFNVTSADSARSAIDALTRKTPDVIVLDLSLPDTDGIDLIRQVRNWLAAPILVLTVRDNESDKIAALETGADDYLTKPFSAGELVARVRALLRRSSAASATQPVLEVGNLRIDIGERLVTRDGEPAALTPTEFDLLAALASHPDRLMTWSQLSDAVWGHDAMVDVRTIRVHVSNLRHKIEQHPSVPRLVLTEPGIGLRFNTR